MVHCDHFGKWGWLYVCLQVELLWITVITMKSGVGYVYVYRVNKVYTVYVMQMHKFCFKSKILYLI